MKPFRQQSTAVLTVGSVVGRCRGGRTAEPRPCVRRLRFARRSRPPLLRCWTHAGRMLRVEFVIPADPNFIYHFEETRPIATATGEFHGNQHTEHAWEGYEYDDLVADVAELAEELDRAPRTDDADRDERFPSLARIYEIIEDDCAQVLRDAGVSSDPIQVGSYDEADYEAMLDDMRCVCETSGSDYRTSREYLENGNYASSSIRERFGSWGSACSAAGIRPGSKHGEQCLGPNGQTLGSRHEQAVAYMLDDHGIEYGVHPSVPDTPWGERLPTSQLRPPDRD